MGRLVLGLLLALLSGCATLDRVADHVLAEATEIDPITGQRRLSDQSEEDEIKLAQERTAQLLDAAQHEAIGVNVDAKAADALQELVKRIAAVSHRPNLPWQAYLIEVNDDNAFTIGGGKVFVFRGLFGGLVRDEQELAAVIAHEIAHVTARHASENNSVNLVAQVGNRKRKRDTVFRASYSTVQEDEADRLGLLYMALAGFDPGAAARLWERAHQERGSQYGDNTHDHSAPLDRWRRVTGLVPTALRYYRGPGTVNPDYESILASNPISGTKQQTASKGVLGLLEAGAGAAGDYMATRKEQDYREAARLREQQALSLVQLGEWKIAPTKDGHKGIFGAPHAGRSGQLGHADTGCPGLGRVLGTSDDPVLPLFGPAPHRRRPHRVGGHHEARGVQVGSTEALLQFRSQPAGGNGMNRPLETPKGAPGQVAPSTKYDPQREVFPRPEPSRADLTKVSSTPAPAGPATKVKIDLVVPKKR